MTIPEPAVQIAAEKIWRLIWEDDDFKPFSEASKESREICLEGAEELLAAALPHLRVQETRAYEWSAAIRRRGKVDRFGVTFCDDESEYAKRFALDEMYDGERSGQEGEEFVLMRRSIGEWEVTGRE